MQRLWRLMLLLSFLCPAQAELAQPLDTVIPAFDRLVTEWFPQSGVPGMSVAVVSGDQVVYLKSFGVRQAGSDQPVDADTVFQLASCSKPVTSTALAILASQGKLAWDDRVHHRLPELVLSDPWISENVTYADLLSHRSSLPEAAGDILENLGFERDEILSRLRHLPPAYDFRAGYAYSNYGYTAAGEAAARAVGRSYEDLMEQTLFEPLGMSATSARFDDFMQASNRASSHIVQDGKAYPTVRMPQAQAPAGGVSSSARDLSRWLMLHLQQGQLDGKALAQAEKLADTYQVHSLASNNPATFSGSGFYGLGWGISYDRHGRLQLSHSGAFAMGVRTIATMLPEEKVGLVVLCNAYPSGTPEALSVAFFELADGGTADLGTVRKIDGEVRTLLDQMLAGYQPPHPARPNFASRPLSGFTGRFGNDYFGDATVSLSGQTLTLNLGRKSFPLRHLNGDVFLVAVPQRSNEDLVPFEIQFVSDGSGQVVGFRQKGLADTPVWFPRH
jgi:CubicO group peptidase (beta-lactamase class C family)